MENGLNLETAIRSVNLAIVSDQYYTVHCRPLYKAVFGHTSANVSNGGWTESRHSYLDKFRQILVMESGLYLEFGSYPYFASNLIT